MNIDELAAAYALVQPHYKTLAEWVSGELVKAVASNGLAHVTVDARPKEASSFLKKAIRKAYADPLNDITDKAGVRIIVPHLDEVTVVAASIERTFVVSERQNKADELEENELGYLGVHFLVKPMALPEELVYLADLVCEIQIHTIAQNAWAMVSHPLLYKPTGSQAASGTARRINRLVALVELFDQEVASARSEIMRDPKSPELAMLEVLERPFYALTGKPYDETLSLHILNVVQRSYSEQELNSFDELMTAFVGKQGDYFADRVRRATEDGSVDPLLTQPEALAVLERLNHAKAKLRAEWDATLDSRLLDRLSEALGRPA